jgi:hypothetical protein
MSFVDLEGPLRLVVRTAFQKPKMTRTTQSQDCLLVA